MGMLTVLLGAVMNIILDPILIFGFNMGVQARRSPLLYRRALPHCGSLLFLQAERHFLSLPGIP